MYCFLVLTIMNKDSVNIMRSSLMSWGVQLYNIHLHFPWVTGYVQFYFQIHCYIQLVHSLTFRSHYTFLVTVTLAGLFSGNVNLQTIFFIGYSKPLNILLYLLIILSFSYLSKNDWWDAETELSRRRFFSRISSLELSLSDSLALACKTPRRESSHSHRHELLTNRPLS